MTKENIKYLNGQTYMQGKFLKFGKYKNMSQGEVNAHMYEESCTVRTGGYTENAICKTNDPEIAEWIAARLNFCRELEKICESKLYDALMENGTTMSLDHIKKVGMVMQELISKIK